MFFIFYPMKFKTGTGGITLKTLQVVIGLRLVHTVQFVAYVQLLEIHRFMNYCFELNTTVQNNRIIQIALCELTLSVHSCSARSVMAGDY